MVRTSDTALTDLYHHHYHLHFYHPSSIPDIDTHTFTFTFTPIIFIFIFTQTSFFVMPTFLTIYGMFTHFRSLKFKHCVLCCLHLNFFLFNVLQLQLQSSVSMYILLCVCVCVFYDSCMNILITLIMNNTHKALTQVILFSFFILM